MMKDLIDSIERVLIVIVTLAALGFIILGSAGILLFGVEHLLTKFNIVL